MAIVNGIARNPQTRIVMYEEETPDRIELPIAIVGWLVYLLR